MSKPVNHVRYRTGNVSAVCRFCGTKARAIQPNEQGEPDLWKMANGWSEAPFPADSVHDDGSVGSLYCCPACNNKLRAGQSLRQRQYLT